VPLTETTPPPALAQNALTPSPPSPGPSLAAESKPCRDAEHH